MICYKGRSFCSASRLCCAICDRRLTNEQAEEAAKLNLDVSYMDFKDGEECPGFELCDEGNLEYHGT